jgi:prepilin-type N-terminal cleavage/methylation domain-containing protein
MSRGLFMSKKAFTLAEVLITLLIMALILLLQQETMLLGH